MSMLKAALAYSLQGLPVFPCQGKKPFPGTRGFLDATTDMKQIEAWWTATPDANIGIATGKKAGFVVIDIDKNKSGYESFSSLCEDLRSFPMSDPETQYIITGTGGMHIYFRYQEGIRNKQEFRPGLDVRGEGGYVLAPPSVHPDTGQPYEGTVDFKRLTYMPPQLASLLITPEPVLAPAKRESEAVLQAGGRHKYLMQVVGSMRRRGLSDEAILAAIKEENDLQCDPPLPLKDLERMIETSRGYAVEAPIEVDTSEELPDDQRLYVSEEASGRLVKASSLTTHMVAYLNDKSKVKGTPTGFEGLDKLLGGGRRQGEVTCWHAEAKTGKNTLWHYLMYIWLELDIPIAYASRELSPAEEVLPNLLSVATGKNAWLESVGEYEPIIAGWPLYFSDGYGYFAPEQIREWVEHGVEAGIKSFWFDHLHYMLQDPEDHKMASRLIKDLKAIAKVKDISIDIIIQPNKLMDGQKLSLNSIKGGAAMGQAIDNLLILERVRDHKNVSRLTLEVARSKLCSPGSIYLQFDPQSCRFIETEPQEDKQESPEGRLLVNDDIPVMDRRFVKPPTFKTLL